MKWMYCKDVPEGKIFSPEDADELSDDWVDTPAKLKTAKKPKKETKKKVNDDS